MPIIEVHLLDGRTPDEKQVISTALTEAMMSSMGAAREQCIILFHDVRPENYSNAGLTAATRLRQGLPATTN